jgi:beta-glucosidase-like glycosyl hydrolase
VRRHQGDRRFRTALAALLLTAAVVGITGGARGASCPWLDASAPVEDRVAQLLGSMNMAQKLHMVHGALHEYTDLVGPVYAGVIYAVPELCIPQLGLLDGPVGAGDGLTGATEMPAPVALAASWDPAQASAFGDVLGAEVDGKGANVSLAPAVDIVRDPRAGRSFEGFGEDPYLASRMAVPEIQAIQSHGVIDQVKHFAAYTHETLRDSELDDVVVDERTLHEIYLPAFEAAITEGGAGSVMCSYNSVNGAPACGNPYLLTQVLKGQWGFDGFVTADWYAMHSSGDSANAGLDMQMPDDCYFGPALKRAINQGRVPLTRLDDMVARILRSMFRAGLFDRPLGGAPDSIVATPAHAAASRSVAQAGMVLLKNKNVLPIRSTVSSIALIGAAKDGAITGGGGSSAVNPSHVVTPLQGIRRRAGSGVKVTYDDGTTIVTAVQKARSATLAIVFARLKQGEFKDRLSLQLFPTDTVLIEAVAAANPNTIVVLNNGSAVTMPWLPRVKGVLEAWYPGQEYGDALASILFGDVNPSGKLPMTFPKNETQIPATTLTRYSEGLFVGYRHYDQNGIPPLFPFGFGLSYSSFSFSNLALSSVATGDGSLDVSADVTNTGARAGAEVAQLYLEYPAGAGEPPRVLRGFQKMFLEPGETKTAHFTLSARAFSVWDTASHRWKATAGRYVVRLGNSSRNLPLTAPVTLTSTILSGTPTPPAPAFTPDPLATKVVDWRTCPKDFFAPFVNGVLSITGLPPLEVLGRPIP